MLRYRERVVKSKELYDKQEDRNIFGGGGGNGPAQSFLTPQCRSTNKIVGLKNFSLFRIGHSIQNCSDTVKEYINQ